MFIFFFIYFCENYEYKIVCENYEYKIVLKVIICMLYLLVIRWVYKISIYLNIV